jgi:hypothetical protein
MHQCSRLWLARVPGRQQLTSSRDPSGQSMPGPQGAHSACSITGVGCSAMSVDRALYASVEHRLPAGQPKLLGWLLALQGQPGKTVLGAGAPAVAGLREGHSAAVLGLLAMAGTRSCGGGGRQGRQRVGGRGECEGKHQSALLQAAGSGQRGIQQVMRRCAGACGQARFYSAELSRPRGRGACVGWGGSRTCRGM